MKLRFLLLVISVSLSTGCVTENSGLLAKPSSDIVARAGNHIELAAGYINLGRLEIAQQEIKKALEIDPDNSQAFHVAAVLNMKLTNYVAAEKNFRQALKLKPTNGASAHELGVLLCKSGKKNEGVSFLKKARDNQFFSSRALSYLRSGECVGKTSPTEARGYFSKALTINPNLDVALYRTAEVYFLEGYPVKARDFYERYMKNRKHNAQTLLLGYRIETSAQSQVRADSYANRLRNEFSSTDEAKKLRQLINQ